MVGHQNKGAFHRSEPGSIGVAQGPICPQLFQSLSGEGPGRRAVAAGIVVDTVQLREAQSLFHEALERTIERS